MTIMKKIILALVFGVLTTAMTFAQTPQKMNYQGIARATSGVPLENQSLGIRISILNGTTAEYVEAHTVTTNAFGLYTLAIGDGIPQTGNIATID